MMPLQCDILNTGSELVLGRTLNRHGAWLGQKLFSEGIEVRRALTLPDGDIIRHELADSMAQADIVLVTGGLGPTSDDLTRDYVADLLGLGMTLDAETLSRIEARLAARGRVCNDGQRKQALVPHGAVILPNERGTAPGLAFTGEDVLKSVRARMVCLLPGPPGELHPMFIEQVIPLLRTTFAGQMSTRSIRELHFAGIGEGELADRIDTAMAGISGLEIGYCAHSMGTVEVRLIGAEDVLEQAVVLAKQVAAKELFSESSPDLERAVVERLLRRGETVALAESCTGGALASRLTDVPGASGVFGCGIIAYANDTKSAVLGVSPDVLEIHGAVSAEVAIAMAEGALRVGAASHALALTGIAGPGGGLPDKPLGTLWLALASSGRETIALHQRFLGDRAAFKRSATTHALDLLRRRLDGLL